MFNILCGAPTCNIGVESIKLIANTKRLSNAGLMLSQRLRRWPNIKLSLGDAPGHILLSAMYPYVSPAPVLTWVLLSISQLNCLKPVLKIDSICSTITSAFCCSANYLSGYYFIMLLFPNTASK